MSKFTCPYCYRIHEEKTCGVKCSYRNHRNVMETCVDASKPGFVDRKDQYGYILPQFRKTCAKCKSAGMKYYCNVANKEIPRDFLNGPSFSVAILGAKASGKSNYIGVLINSIKNEMSKSFNCILNTAASEESWDQYNNHYYEPLFNQKVVIPATANDILPPMIFPLRFLESKMFNKNQYKVDKVAALTFYDTAGEKLNSTDTMLAENQYITNANGIILLLDPLQVPSVREQLRGKMQLPAQNSDTAEVLAKIIETIRMVNKVRGIIDIPIALVFTKIDVLEKFDLLRENSVLYQESEHLARGIFVKDDFNAVNREMRALIDNWVDSDLSQQLKNFKTVAMFGVSALGGIPVGAKLEAGKITPRRVLDPLLWLFAEKKYIKTDR
nr:hypothetical protein [Clostridia bacterium]